MSVTIFALLATAAFTRCAALEPAWLGRWSAEELANADAIGAHGSAIFKRAMVERIQWAHDANQAAGIR
jgi:hypothetical protein